MLQILEKEIRNAKLTFTNQRALFWNEEKLLVISDLHIGKAAHFRKNGIAVSSEILLSDLGRLENLINFFKPKKILIVGDLFHAGYNSDLELFRIWRFKSFPEFMLVRGNHDSLRLDQYEDLGIKVAQNELEIHPFKFIHHPNEIEETKFYVSGHIHPGFALHGKTERLLLPCFALSNQQIILPAFSKFTGLDTKTISGKFKNIVFTDDTIFEL